MGWWVGRCWGLDALASECCEASSVGEVQASRSENPPPFATAFSTTFGERLLQTFLKPGEVLGWRKKEQSHHCRDES